MPLPKHTMTVADVAKVLGVGPDRIRQMDRDLLPSRRENGHRRYDPSIVQRYAIKRSI